MSTITEETTTVVETVVVEEPQAETPKMRHIINPPANLHIFRPMDERAGEILSEGR